MPINFQFSLRIIKKFWYQTNSFGETFSRIFISIKSTYMSFLKFNICNFLVKRKKLQRGENLKFFFEIVEYITKWSSKIFFFLTDMPTQFLKSGEKSASSVQSIAKILKKIWQFWIEFMSKQKRSRTYK